MCFMPTKYYQILSFCLLPSAYLSVSFVNVSVCASVQLEILSPENMNKTTDVRALGCTTFHFMFSLHQAYGSGEINK